ncbi:hypothetical protein RFI_03587, partial [Reticulomyxa filosa]
MYSQHNILTLQFIDLLLIFLFEVFFLHFCYYDFNLKIRSFNMSFQNKNLTCIVLFSLTILLSANVFLNLNVFRIQIKAKDLKLFLYPLILKRLVLQNKKNEKEVDDAKRKVDKANSGIKLGATSPPNPSKSRTPTQASKVKSPQESPVVVDKKIEQSEEEEQNKQINKQTKKAIETTLSYNLFFGYVFYDEELSRSELNWIDKSKIGTSSNVSLTLQQKKNKAVATTAISNRKEIESSISEMRSPYRAESQPIGWNDYVLIHSKHAQKKKDLSLVLKCTASSSDRLCVCVCLF